MATITIEEIKEIVSTSLADYMIQALIDQVDSADDCLNGLGITDDQIKAIKAAGVAHILTLQQKGGVSSEATKTGASRSYFDGDSINSTPYGKMMQTMAGYECLTSAIGSDSSVYFAAITGKRR